MMTISEWKLYVSKKAIWSILNKNSGVKLTDKLREMKSDLRNHEKSIVRYDKSNEGQDSTAWSLLS